ncbi:D-alanyl-D-alanine carboxypeptidase family protein [bacterium]|nr:D-alanyl-D-alanine carboxypeptidase family protein [bacterium]
MSDKAKQNPKEAKESTASTENMDSTRAKRLAEQVKKRGKEKAIIASSERSLATLRENLGVEPKSSESLSFSSKELQRIEKALHLHLTGLNKKTLAYRIKMLTVEELEKAETIEAGTGARLFTILERANKKESVSLGYKFKKNDKITVHFRNNEVAEDNYGMRHLFKKQPEIRQVRIKQTTARGKGREGIATRRSLDGNFYFDDGSYAPIFTGTQIEVVQIFSKAQLNEYKKNSVKYNIGGKTRYLPSSEAEQYSKYYGIAPPSTTRDINQNREYWRRINGTDYSQSNKKRRVVSATEYIPKNERGKQFISKWREIIQINSLQQLIDMRDQIPLLPDDPIVAIPGERRGMRLRYGAALRYALFKRYAEIKGHRVSLTSSYRSAKLQAKLWYRGLAKRMRKYHLRYPNKSSREIGRMAIAENRRFIAPPGRSHHNTGGAIDMRISGLTMRKYRGSRRNYQLAMRTETISTGVTGNNKKALETVLYMNRELKASYFLGTNYFHETWHWNIDKRNGKMIYRNV